MKIYCSTNKSIFEKLAGKDMWVKGTASRDTAGIVGTLTISVWFKILYADSIICRFSIVNPLVMSNSAILECYIDGTYTMHTTDEDSPMTYTINYPLDILTDEEFKEIKQQDNWTAILFKEYSGEA